jgi:uncharacterized SAM-binding protein YcdF (DUF218 family)
MLCLFSIAERYGQSRARHHHATLAPFNNPPAEIEEQVLYILLPFLILLLVLYACRRQLLRGLAKLLVVNGAPSSRDAIVLMNGNISTRPYLAAKLYKDDPSPILIVRLADTEEVRLGVVPNVTDATRDLLVRLGVPDTAVTVLRSDRWVAGTWAEAILLCEHIRAADYRRLVIVTDAFHTRRARWTFRQVMRDDRVVFHCAATPFSLGLLDRWWRSEYGLVHVIVEAIKFAHYRRVHRRARRLQAPAESDLPPGAATRRLVSGHEPADGDSRDPP